LEQQDLNKRLLIALVLSLFVLIGYSYLFPQTQPKQVKEKTVESSRQEVPKIDTLNKSVPSTSTNVTNDSVKAAPVESTSSGLATIKSNHFQIDIDDLGRIKQVELLEKKYKDKEGNTLKFYDNKPEDMKNVKPLEVRFSDASLNEEAFKTPYTLKGDKILLVTNDSKSLTLTQKLSSLTVTKKITFKPNGEYEVEISTSSPAQFFITPGHRPVADTSVYMLVRGALIENTDGIITTIEDGDAKGDEKFPNAKIASAFDRYVASMFFDFDGKGLDVSVLKETNGDPLIFVKGENSLKLHAYIGSKNYEVLKNINPELTNAIEFGWFSFLSKPFYKVLLWINSYIGNWGWAIILFTLLVKFILFPLSYKGMMSMQKMKDLAPKMKELKEKYKGDPAKMNAQMMELYKKHGANPMGGCLPLILQIPVFFALYRVLLNAVELEGAPWILWIENLAQMDPYYVLPILMGISMWFQQRITPTNMTDPLQEKIFKFFPVIMTVFFIYFPSGLVLYWLVNNLFTIGQQYFINHMYAKQKAMAVASHKK